MARPLARLFHAVVVVGAAADGGPEASPGSSTPAATPQSRSMRPRPPADPPSTCPPGSETPFPPCYYIR